MKQSIVDYNPFIVEPTAYITMGKQRLKQSGNQVYLRDKDTFEIELFNPKSISILAKIKLNGNYISGGGIVLRPGERIFLERYLDTNNRFVFTTYDIDEDIVTVRAISENGNVDIEFYNEYIPNTYVAYTAGYNFNPSFTTLTATPSSGGCSTLTSGNPAVYSSNCSTQLLCDSVSAPKLSKKIETGVVDKGEKTNQHFSHSNKTFEWWASSIVSWKILPKSQQYVSSSDLKQYCTECGAVKKKDTHKFCPHCGTKY